MLAEPEFRGCVTGFLFSSFRQFLVMTMKWGVSMFEKSVFWVIETWESVRDLPGFNGKSATGGLATALRVLSTPYFCGDGELRKRV